jgi:hypothetical protein
MYTQKIEFSTHISSAFCLAEYAAGECSGIFRRSSMSFLVILIPSGSLIGYSVVPEKKDLGTSPC